MNKIGRLYILLSWTLAVFMLISFPMPAYEGTKITIYDKFVHAFLFGVFSYLVIYNLVPFRGKKLKLSFILLIGFTAGTVYSGFSEYLQIFVPGRTVSEYDFMGGVAGVLVSLIISYAVFRKRKA